MGEANYGFGKSFMIKRTFYIARDSTLKSFSIFNVKPTERWLNIHDGSVFFPNISYHPIVAGLFGLEKFLSFLDVPIGICWKIGIEEHGNECIITILDKNVKVQTKASDYKYKDHS